MKGEWKSAVIGAALAAMPGQVGAETGEHAERVDQHPLARVTQELRTEGLAISPIVQAKIKELTGGISLDQLLSSNAPNIPEGVENRVSEEIQSNGWSMNVSIDDAETGNLRADYAQSNDGYSHNLVLSTSQGITLTFVVSGKMENIEHVVAETQSGDSGYFRYVRSGGEVKSNGKISGGVVDVISVRASGEVIGRHQEKSGTFTYNGELTQENAVVNFRVRKGLFDREKEFSGVGIASGDDSFRICMAGDVCAMLDWNGSAWVYSGPVPEGFLPEEAVQHFATNMCAFGYLPKHQSDYVATVK